ncbi:MAG: PHP domain-containing protein [Candidatus Pacebacteria bacterium]|nr:PHP domain-containing protein [Candidatus Paceibacterota bacterium]
MYYYDLHCHTNVSKDSFTDISDAVSVAKKRGLDGIAITNHNKKYDGPLMIDGIQIIPSIEVTIETGSHLLAYFVNNDIPKRVSFDETINNIRAQGGYAVLAHPYRKTHGWFDLEDLDNILSIVDGVEVGNALDCDDQRELANKLLNNDLVRTAGSDAHMAGQVGFAVVEVRERLTKDNFKEVLKDAKIVIAPGSHNFRMFWHLRNMASKIKSIIKDFKVLRFVFYRVIMKSYFTIKNRSLLKIKFNYKNE